MFFFKFTKQQFSYTIVNFHNKDIIISINDALFIHLLENANPWNLVESRGIPIALRKTQCWKLQVLVDYLQGGSSRLNQTVISPRGWEFFIFMCIFQIYEKIHCEHKVFYYTSTKSWRGYIFITVCLCVCLSVSVCVRCFLVNKIPAERMNRFGRGFR